MRRNHHLEDIFLRTPLWSYSYIIIWSINFKFSITLSWLLHYILKLFSRYVWKKMLSKNIATFLTLLRLCYSSQIFMNHFGDMLPLQLSIPLTEFILLLFKINLLTRVCMAQVLITVFLKFSDVLVLSYSNLMHGQNLRLAHVSVCFLGYVI